MTNETQLNEAAAAAPVTTEHSQARLNNGLSLKHFAVVLDWKPKLSEKVWCTWFDLLVHVNRRPDLYNLNNSNTVTASQQQLAKILGKSEDTLRSHTRTLWEYGLLDMIEYKGGKKKGSNPINYIVYDYPQNNVELGNKPLVKIRDFKRDYKAGNFEVYVKDRAQVLGSEIRSIDEVRAQKQVEEMLESMKPIDFNEYYATFAVEIEAERAAVPAEYDEFLAAAFERAEEIPVNAAADVESYPQYPQRAEEIPVIESQRAEKIRHINISNSLGFINKSNSNDLINESNKDFNNSFSSSSLSISEVSKNEEEEKNVINSQIDFTVVEMIKDVLQDNGYPNDAIAAVEAELIEQQFNSIITVDTVQKQIEITKAYEKKEPIRNYPVFFVNGLKKRAAFTQQHKVVDPNEKAAQLLEAQGRHDEAAILRNPTPKRKVPFYNWLDEREGA